MGTEKPTAKPVSAQATNGPADPAAAPITLMEMGTVTHSLETLSKQVRLLRYGLAGAMDDLKDYCEERDLEYELLPLYDYLLEIQCGVEELEALAGRLHARLREPAPAARGAQ